MAKYHVQQAPGLDKSARGELEDLVFDTRANAEHYVERRAAEFAAQFTIVTDSSEDETKLAAEVEKERKSKLDRERQRKDFEKFAAERI